MLSFYLLPVLNTCLTLFVTNYAGPKLTREVIDICDAIVEQSAADVSTSDSEEGLRALKLRLQSAAGSVRAIYDVIRYFKWHKTACVWRYPEVVAMQQQEREMDEYEEKEKDEMAAGEVGSTASRPHGAGGGEGGFYGLRPAQARSAAFVIRSLHSDVSSHSL